MKNGKLKKLLDLCKFSKYFTSPESRQCGTLILSKSALQGLTEVGSSPRATAKSC
jgi:hypothetical protein